MDWNVQQVLRAGPPRSVHRAGTTEEQDATHNSRGRDGWGDGKFSCAWGEQELRIKAGRSSRRKFSSVRSPDWQAHPQLSVC